MPLTLTLTLDNVAGLAVATLVGAAVGVERQWSGHATGPHARFGGIRTFTLLGALAGIAGWLTLGGQTAIAVVLLAAAVALLALSYAAASRTDIDATTEVAALVVLASGTLAGAGYLALASAIGAGTVLLLVEKSRLHALVARIDDASLRASVRFAAMACIVLPLLPAGPYGPYGAIRPRELWALALFFSGLSFGGWIARRLVGPRRGTIVSGLLGGVISSTSTTLQCARESRSGRAPQPALAAAAVAASTVMLARVLVACAILNPALAVTLPRYLWPAFAIGAVTVFLAWRERGASEVTVDADGSPLQLRTALQMTALFQLMLFVILAVQARAGDQALVATSALVGLTNLDALTLSLARAAALVDDLEPLTMALIAGIIANTALKLGLAVALGQGTFRTRTAVVLGGMIAVTAAAVLIP